jgi:predicted choloylglycine hydrolase
MVMDRINTRGTHYEIGCQQGRLYYALVGKVSFMKMLREMNMIESTYIVKRVGKSVFNFVFDQLISSGARKMVRSVKEHLPNQYDKLEGIAEGFGARVNKHARALFFENYSGKTDMETHVPKSKGCTAAIITNKSKQGFLIKNYDFPCELEDYQIIRFTDLKDGYSSVCIGEGPMPGCISGMNEMGLTISMNAAFTKDINLSNPPGTMYCQEVLDTLSNTQEAVEYLTKVPMPVGWIFIILDKKNDGAVVERSATKSSVRSLETTEHGEIAVATNNYINPTTIETQIPDDAEWTVQGLEGYKIVGLSKWRYDRMSELVERESNHKSISIKSLHKIMSDHKRPPTNHDETICRHSEKLYKTLSTVYFNPKKMKISIQNGNPCGDAPLESYKVEFNYKIQNIRYLRRIQDVSFYDRLV